MQTGPFTTTAQLAQAILGMLETNLPIEPVNLVVEWPNEADRPTLKLERDPDA